MISKYLKCMVVIFILVFVSGTGSIETGKYVIENKDLCTYVQNSKTSIINSVKSQLMQFSPDCIVEKDCLKLSCSATADHNNDIILGGYELNLCEQEPTANFWLDFPNASVWSFKWSQSFKVSNEEQEVEIIRHDSNGTRAEHGTRWYMIVTMKCHSSSSVTLQASLKVCDKQRSCETQAPFLFVPDTSVSRLCPSYEKRRTSRSSGETTWEDAVHHAKSSNSAKFGGDGRSCRPSNLFSCGANEACVNRGTDIGVCMCIQDFVRNSTGWCVVQVVNDDPVPQPVTSNSTSAALGAFVSVLMLLVIAAVVFLGVKYNILARIRNRIPICFPFGRVRLRSNYTENVTMVNPLSVDDDDPPLL